MYLDFLVKVPTVKGKITRRKKSNVVYIEYEYDRVYDPSRKYTFPKRVTIGKLSDTDPELMKPNQNFLKYFPDAELPESKNRTSRSSCLRVGTYFVLRKIIEECSLNDILGKYFGSRDMSALVNELILENKGTFENKRVNNIYEYGVYGKTIRHKLYVSDKKERYFHLYHSISKESAERIEIENRINQMTQYLKKYQNKVKEFGPGFEKYFNLHYDEKSQAFILPEERCSVVERELDLAGYFCIVTSEKMSAKEAIELYKSRDVSEKLFRGDKSYPVSSCKKWAVI